MSDYDHLSPTMKTVLDLISRSTLFIYALIAILLIVIALLTFFDAAYLILTIFSHENLIQGIVEILYVLLLTIIVVEVLETVTSYFRTGRILVRPILIAGLTAMVRKVLIINIEEMHITESIALIGIIGVLVAGIYVMWKTEQ